jgi:hypothetical protein
MQTPITHRLLCSVRVKFSFIIVLAGWIVCTTPAFSDSSFKDYANNLKLLTLSDPKPAIANIAGGFGAGHGLFYAAVSYSDYDLQTKDRNDDDGSIAFGLGLGDPVNSFGGEITIGITSVSTSFWGDGEFADEGNFSGKVHRRVEPLMGGNAASVSLGVSNIAGWGSTKDNPANYYAAYSEQQNFGSVKQYGVAYTLGYGSAVSDTETNGDPFAGVAIGYDDYSFSLSQIGRETHIATTLFFPSMPGIGLTIAQADALNELNSKRLILSLSFSKKLF